MLTAEHQLWVFHSQHSRTSSTDLTLGLRSSHRSQVPTRGSPLSITFDSRPAVLRSPRHVDVPVCHAPHVVLLLSGRVRGQVSVRVMEVCSCGCRAHGAHTHTCTITHPYCSLGFAMPPLKFGAMYSQTTRPCLWMVKISGGVGTIWHMLPGRPKPF